MANQTTYELLLELAAKMDPSYRSALENARRGTEEVGDSARGAGDDLDVMDIALGNLIANGITKLISAAGNAVKSIYNLSEETREFRQDMGTLETAFDSAGFSADTATDTWMDLYSVLGEDDRAVETANNISRMAKSQEDLDDWVRITTGLWGTYQDALPVESLAESAAETAKVGKITGTMADALNWSSDAAALLADYMSDDVTTAEDAFNEALSDCNDEAERQALITDILTTLYGDAADKYEETAGSIMEANEAQAEYLLTQAEMGEKIEPVTTAVSEGITSIKQAFLDLFSEVDFDAMADKVSAGFDWLVNTAGPWIINNLPTIATLFGGVTAAIVAQSVASGVCALKQKALAAGITLTAYAQKTLNTAMKANVIGLIITGITLLVSAFVYLWNNCEGFRNFWINLWAGIKSTAAAVSEWFTGTFVPAVTAIWEVLSGYISNWYQNVLAPIIDGIKQTFNGIIEFIQGVFSGNWSQAWQGIVDTFGGIFGTISGLVKAPINSVITLINGVIGRINGISVTIPDWVPKFGGNTFSLNIPEIPALAAGGIVTDPTLAMIGEGKEDEAVLPLSKLGDLMGNSDTTSIVYSPTINVMPGASAEDVKAATAESFEQFKSYMDRYLRERKRLQFA